MASAAVAANLNKRKVYRNSALPFQRLKSILTSKNLYFFLNKTRRKQKKNVATKAV